LSEGTVETVRGGRLASSRSLAHFGGILAKFGIRAAITRSTHDQLLMRFPDLILFLTDDDMVQDNLSTIKNDSTWANHDANAQAVHLPFLSTPTPQIEDCEIN
jgi:hypothetical protein